MNNTQQLASPVWAQFYEAWNDGVFFSQQGNRAAAESSSLMNRIDRTFSNARLVSPSPLALEPPARSMGLAPPSRSASDAAANVERAPLAERSVLLLSAESAAEPPQEIDAPPAPSRKRQREAVAASSSSFSSPLLDFETVYADLIQLLGKYSVNNQSHQPPTLCSNIAPLILMIDDQVPLDRDQKKRLLDFFDSAKHYLPPLPNENPWLDLFCANPQFETRLFKILGKETFLELVDSFLPEQEDDEEKESVCSPSIQRAHAPRFRCLTVFDEHFVRLEYSLDKMTAMPDRSKPERQKKRDQIKHVIVDKINKGFKKLARVTEEQADRLVQLMIKTGKKYPNTSHSRAESFYDFCATKLEGLLGQAKIDQLVLALKNQSNQ